METEITQTKKFSNKKYYYPYNKKRAIKIEKIANYKEEE